jgi:hypothetical protein
MADTMQFYPKPVKEWVVKKWVRDCDLERVLNEQVGYEVVAMFRNSGAEETTTIVFQLGAE